MKNDNAFCNQLPSSPGASATLRRAVASAMGSGFIPPFYPRPTPLYLCRRGSTGPAFCTQSVHVSRSEGAFLGFFFCTSKRRNCPRGMNACNRIPGECTKKGREPEIWHAKSPAQVMRRGVYSYRNIQAQQYAM